MDHALFAAFLQGWLMTAGLIVAIGAQNALVLRQGLMRRHVGPVVALCVVSDALLIGLGVLGIGAMVRAVPSLLDILRYGGAAVVLVYGLHAGWRAWRGVDGLPADAARGHGLGATLGAAMALTYLNPHVFLDALLLGSAAAQHRGGQGLFTLGAVLASLMWFSLLGYGAAAAAPWLRRPKVWRALEAGVAVMMGGVAWQLLRHPVAGS